MKYTGLEEKLNVETVISEDEPSVPPVVEDDHAHARETMHALIQKGTEALDGILNVAKHSEHPRSYEVAGQLIKTVSEVTKNLIELQKLKKEVEDDGRQPKIATQNNLFVGSTHELMRMMKKLPTQEILPAEVKITE